MNRHDRVLGTHALGRAGVVPANRAASKNDMDQAIRKFGKAVLDEDSFDRLSDARWEQAEDNVPRCPTPPTSFTRTIRLSSTNTYSGFSTRKNESSHHLGRTIVTEKRCSTLCGYRCWKQVPLERASIGDVRTPLGGSVGRSG